MAHVEEEANHLPTPPAQYGPVHGCFRQRQLSRREAASLPGSTPIPVGARCTNTISSPLLWRQQRNVHRSHHYSRYMKEPIINPLKGRREEPDRQGVGKRRRITREERLQALDFEKKVLWQRRKRLKSTRRTMNLPQCSATKFTRFLAPSHWLSRGAPYPRHHNCVY
jgi:hypothetical protein